MQGAIPLFPNVRLWFGAQLSTGATLPVTYLQHLRNFWGKN